VALFAALPSAAAPGLDATFKSLDANGDGALTIEEFSKKLPDGMSQKKLQQGGPPPAASDPAKAKVYVILPDTDGKAAAQLRGVNFTAVSAAPPVAMEDRRRADFTNYDANKDGKVDLGEYRARFRAMLSNGFGELDQDKSGGLDPKEYEALSATVLAIPVDAITAFGTAGQYGPLMAPETLDAAFKAHDLNKDGKLSLDEYLPPASMPDPRSPRRPRSSPSAALRGYARSG
jgi:Ca2+-binding EF-hand superfamily protein